MRNVNYAGVQLSNLTALSYYAYSAMNNGQQFPYLSLDVSCAGCSGGSTPNSDRLFFEPPYQTPATNANPNCPDEGAALMLTWQYWDALHGCWWDNNGELGYPPCGFNGYPACIPQDPINCPTTTYCAGGGALRTAPLTDFIAKHPDAKIYNPATLDSPKGVGGLRLLVGFGSPTDNFDGNVDMVSVGVGGNSTSYDFEPPTCREADANGDFHGNHGDGDVKMDNDNCEETGQGGNGEGSDNVQSTNRGDGKDFQSTTIESTAFDSTANTMTVTGLGVSAGSPVAFTLVVVEPGLITPGFVSMTFSDGYSNAGSLLTGSIVLN